MVEAEWGERRPGDFQDSRFETAGEVFLAALGFANVICSRFEPYGRSYTANNL